MVKKLMISQFLLLFSIFNVDGSSESGTLLPEILSPATLKPPVRGILELPEGSGPHPAIVILHGSAGWRSEYSIFAKNLADSGFAALVLDYYNEVGGAPIRSAEKLKKWPHWQKSVRSAVRFLQANPFINGHKLGLLGFSRGAFLAVSVAASIPGLNAVVDFYGGGGGGVDDLEEEVKGLPPILILHGSDDKVVPVSFAYRLGDAARKAGGKVETHIYPDTGHAFNLPGYSTFNETSSSDAFSKTVKFLREQLVD
jgi:carboxymethylenebutenolidase